MKKVITPDAVRGEIEAIASSGYRDIAKHLPHGMAPFGFFCPLVPEELIYAAGGLPFRLLGGPAQIARAQAHLPPYCCHLVRSSLESLLAGELGFLQGIVFCQTCDSMKGLADIWARLHLTPAQFNLMIPTNLSSPDARPYLRAELDRFRGFLNRTCGEITEEGLAAAIRLFNRIRKGFGGLYEMMSKGGISGGILSQVVRVGYWMDRRYYLELIESLLASPPQQQPDSRIPVYVTGNMAHLDPYFSLIEQSGGLVVHDDLCSGARMLRLMVAEDRDPMEAMVDRYFNAYFCPTKYMAPEARIEILREEVKTSGAQGVIFLLYKYCEPCFFDYPDLKAALEREGIPTLLLEVEDPGQGREQLQVRIQAFLEMLNPL